MKNILIFTAVFLLSAISPLPAYSDLKQKGWLAINEISDFECNIILNASKKPCARIIENADAFILEKNLVIIRFQKDNAIGYYGYDVKDLSPKTKASSKPNLKPEQTDNNDSNRYDDMDAARAVTLLFSQFYKVWTDYNETNETVDELTPEKLTRADDLMRKYFNLVSQLSADAQLYEIRSTVGPMTTLGNRYAAELENLIYPLADAKLMVTFYDNYIHDAIVLNRNMRYEDKPSAEEKNAALEKLINALGDTQPSEEPPNLFFSTRNFLKDNNPTALQDLIDQRKLAK